MDVRSPAELEALTPELDLFVDSPAPDPHLVEEGLHPPLPVSAGALIWGFALLREALRSGRGGLACRVLPPLAASQRLALALRLEARAGRYSWPEKRNILEFVRRRRAEGEALDLATLAPWIEGRRDPQLEHRIARYSALPPASRQAVAAGSLDLKTAELAGGFPPAVLALIEGAPLSFSRRRQFVELLGEVSRRDRLEAGELEELAARLLGAPLPGGEQPLEALAVLRFPTLTALRERFAALAGGLWKGSGVQIQAPPNFEGESFSVAFGFSSRDDLSRRLRALRAVAEHCDELFALLR